MRRPALLLGVLAPDRGLRRRAGAQDRAAAVHAPGRGHGRGRRGRRRSAPERPLPDRARAVAHQPAREPRRPRPAPLGARTEFGSRRVLGVTARRGGWLAVVASELPNGRVGWIPGAACALASTNWSDRRRPLGAPADAAPRRPRRPPLPGRRRPPGHRDADRPLRGHRQAAARTTPARPTAAARSRSPATSRKLPEGWPGGDRLAIHGTPNAGDDRAGRLARLHARLHAGHPAPDADGPARHAGLHPRLASTALEGQVRVPRRLAGCAEAVHDAPAVRRTASLECAAAAPARPRPRLERRAPRRQPRLGPQPLHRARGRVVVAPDEHGRAGARDRRAERAELRARARAAPSTRGYRCARCGWCRRSAGRARRGRVAAREAEHEQRGVGDVEDGVGHRHRRRAAPRAPSRCARRSCGHDEHGLEAGGRVEARRLAVGARRRSRRAARRRRCRDGPRARSRARAGRRRARRSSRRPAARRRRPRRSSPGRPRAGRRSGCGT